MDFRDWKKTKEDKTSCTLVHPKGHTMTIAIKALPKIHQEQIKRLKFAEGGEVPVGMPDPQKAKDAWDGAQNGQMNRLKELVGYGDKKESKQQPPRHRYAGGTPETPVTADEYLGDDEELKDEAPAPQAAPAQPPVVVNVQAPQAAPLPPPGQMTAPVSTAFRDQIEQPLSHKVQPAQAAPTLLKPNETPDVAAAVGQLQQAGQERAEVEKAQMHAAADSAANRLANEQRIAQREADAYNEVKSATDAFSEYTRKNPINPRAYLENQNGRQKVATAIGLMLGGISQGFNGGKGSNPAADFLDAQITRDIEAQKARHDQQKTVYGYYHNLYGDSNIATNLARVSANNMIAQEAAVAAARTGNQMADIKAKEIGAEMVIKNNQLLIDSAFMLGGGRGRGTGQAPGQQGPSKGKASGAPGKVSDKGAAHPLQENILHPGAERMFQALQYTPKAKDQIPEITRQFTQAQQADKALNSVNETFMNMSQAAEDSGISGRAHRTLSPHAFAAVGAGLGSLAGPAGMGIGAGVGEGVGQAAQQFTNTDTNRRYDSEQSTLKGYISSALKGTNVSSGDIDDIVQKNSPEYGDSTKTKANKLKAIRDFIKNHTETSLLKTWHMTKD